MIASSASPPALVAAVVLSACTLDVSGLGPEAPASAVDDPMGEADRLPETVPEATLPEPTDLTEQCLRRAHAVLDAPVWERRELEEDLSTASVSTALHTALGLFDAVTPEPASEATRAILVETEAGALVELSTDADWSLAFLFDAEGALLMHHLFGASPSSQWYCGAPGAPSREPPDEACTGQLLRFLPHRAEDEVEHHFTYPGLPAEDEAEAIEAGVDDYRLRFDVPEPAVVNVDVALWDATPDGWGARTTVHALERPPVTYYAGGRDDDSGIVLSEVGALGSRAICTEL